MKAFNTILKILAALAAVAGAIYVVATYGDKIVAWAKKVWASMPKLDDRTVIFDEPIQVDTDVPEAPEAAEAPAEEAAEEVTVPEATTETAPQIPETDPVAEEADFAE